MTKDEWGNPIAQIHIEVTDPDGTKNEWMVEGGTPNTLLRRGITRESLKPGTVLVIDGYQTRDHSLLRANGRNVTFPDGRKLFLGSSGTGAPTDGADPSDPAKGRGPGRGGVERRTGAGAFQGRGSHLLSLREATTTAAAGDHRPQIQRL